MKYLNAKKKESKKDIVLFEPHILTKKQRNKKVLSYLKVKKPLEKILDMKFLATKKCKKQMRNTLVPIPTLNHQAIKIQKNECDEIYH